MRTLTLRKHRSDGQETKKKILATAGVIFAEKGYYNTSSKDICEAAGVNAAAINYHFGGKDGLYEKIMEMTIQHFLARDFLHDLYQQPMTADEKLFTLVDHVLAGVLDKRSWHGRVWAREIMSPSPMSEKIINREASERVVIINNILFEALDKPEAFSELDSTYLFFTFMAPCLVLMIVSPHLPTPIQPLFSRPRSEIVEHIIQMVKKRF